MSAGWTVTGKVVVVTGGGSGIGAALARRFAAQGAESVVVVDRDVEAAGRVAADVGGDPRGCDVADDAQVRHLVGAVIDRHGRLDMFCANAGIATGAGLEASDEQWRRALQVNVMAHVYAARAVVPHMLERGSGYFLVTASAAGLLTGPGDAPYTVSKHAAVAFAEWLAVTYGDRGIRVSVLCPMGVATPLLMDPLEAGDPAARAVAASGEIVSPEQVADAVVKALTVGRFLILPHEQVGKFWTQKASDPDRWLSAMRRLVSRPS